MGELVFDGSDVDGIDRIDAVAFADHNDNFFADGYEFRVRHREFAPIGKVDGEGLEAASNHIADVLDVHRGVFVCGRDYVN